jgi:hypothetical protein
MHRRGTRNTSVTATQEAVLLFNVVHGDSIRRLTGKTTIVAVGVGGGVRVTVAVSVSSTEWLIDDSSVVVNVG